MGVIRVAIASSPDELAAAYGIRHAVFCEEQGIDPDLDFDGCDDLAIHLLACCDAHPVGTARIRTVAPDIAKIERLAVLPQYRGRGIGRHLMEIALAELASRGSHRTAIVHAQYYVRQLYQSLGFIERGEPFQEAGIAHIVMQRELLPKACPIALPQADAFTMLTSNRA